MLSLQATEPVTQTGGIDWTTITLAVGAVTTLLAFLRSQKHDGIVRVTSTQADLIDDLLTRISQLEEKDARREKEHREDRAEWAAQHAECERNLTEVRRELDDLRRTQ